MNKIVRPTLLDPTKYVWFSVSNDTDLRLVCKVDDEYYDITYLVDSAYNRTRVRIWANGAWVYILDNASTFAEAMHYTEMHEMAVGSEKVQYVSIDDAHDRMHLPPDTKLFL